MTQTLSAAGCAVGAGPEGPRPRFAPWPSHRMWSVLKGEFEAKVGLFSFSGVVESISKPLGPVWILLRTV